MANKNYAYHNPNQSQSPETSSPAKNHSPGCTIPCLKFSLHLFNVVFVLTGLVLIAVGVRTVWFKHPSLALLSTGIYDLTAYIFVVAGCIIVVTSILGCVGLCRGSHTQVLIYAVLLGLILVIEAGAGALCYIYRGSIGTELTKNLGHKFSEEYGLNPDTTEAVDHLQISLQCCGVNSFEDWNQTNWWNSDLRRTNKVPDSCCISPSTFCGVRDHPSNIRYTGCIDRIEKIAGDNLLIIGAIAIGVCFIQLLGTVMACCLHCKLKDLVYYS